jgi:hypothetical protein
MLKTLTIAAIALATAAATAPAQAGLKGLSTNGPSRQGIQLNNPSINGHTQAGPVALDASGMRVLTIRLRSVTALTAK